MLPTIDSSSDPINAEQLFMYDAQGMRTELIRGRLVVREPAGYRHGDIAVRITVEIALFLRRDQADRAALHPLGDVLAAETGFTLQRNPDTVRAPDVAFVSYHRRPIDQRGFAELAPDLVVEVLSPNDRPLDVLRKVADWLNAGSSLVWVIDPMRRVARVYKDDGGEEIVSESSSLNGDAILPGFTLPLANLFS